MKKKTLKFLDAICGTLLVDLCVLAGKNAGTKPQSFFNILFIRPGGIGDAVLLVPAINSIKRIFPDAAIDILAEKRNAGVLSLTSTVHGIFTYDKPAGLSSVIGRNYDLVIDTEQWHRFSAIAAWLTRAPMLIGFATNERKKLFTHAQPYSHDDYEVNGFLRLLEPVIKEKAVFDPEKPFLDVPPGSQEKAGMLLQPLRNVKSVAIFPGSSIQERKWGSERFRKTASLLSRQGFGIVVVGGKDDIKSGEEIIRGLPDSLNLAGKVTLPLTAAVLKESALLITGDSGIMHIGYGLGIKIVALFGPGREKKWAPRGKNCRVINKRLPCSPCTTFGYTPKCRNNALCMSSISPEEVCETALELLAE